MQSTYKIVRAKKDHRCSELSYHTIRKGELYLYAAFPPWHEINSGKGWWIIKACLRCAEQFGLHTSDTRKQLEQVAT